MSDAHQFGDRSRLRAVSMFSGAGGLDLGVSWAGFDTLACIEIDPHCCATLRRNVPASTTVIESDVRTLDPYRLMENLGLSAGELDLLYGGPPCQPFSQIGRRAGLVDERGLLIFEVLRFVEAFKPKALLIEQVKGLLTIAGQRGIRGELVGEVAARLRTLGYETAWRVLNAADYGVPQKRERLFIVATKESNRFAFPDPTHGPAEARLGLFSNVQPHLTVGEALRGLGRVRKRTAESLASTSHIDVTPDGQRRRMHSVPEGQWLAAQYHLPGHLRQSLKRKDTTKFRRLSRKQPSLTLRCGEIFFHPIQDRYLTPREYMRLHGYPDTYTLTGPIRSRTGRVRFLDQHRQIANSVPPPLAKVLAESIKDMLDVVELPTHAMSLMAR